MFGIFLCPLLVQLFLGLHLYPFVLLVNGLNWKKGFISIFNGVHEMKLSHLTSVQQERDEFVLEFVKCFRYINHRCFHLAISKKRFDLFGFEWFAL